MFLQAEAYRRAALGWVELIQKNTKIAGAKWVDFE